MSVKFHKPFQELHVNIDADVVQKLTTFILDSENYQYYSPTRGIRKFRDADTAFMPHWFCEDRVEQDSYFLSSFWKWGGAIESPAALNYLQTYRELIKPILVQMRNAASEFMGVDFLIYTSEIPIMPPGARMIPHIDIYSNADISQRVHYVLSTNKECRLMSGGEEHHFPVNSCFLFNNGIIHDASNSGNTPRAHIIMDLMEYKYAIQQPNVRIIDPAI